MGESYFDGCEIDRIDVNGNYCKENCRWTTHSVNNHNRRKRKGCTSEYIGVCFNSKTNKYAAQLVKDGALIIRKEFVNELEAAIAYDNASERVYGDRPNKTTSGDSP
jgi:hypothetical protein